MCPSGRDAVDRDRIACGGETCQGRVIPRREDRGARTRAAHRRADKRTRIGPATAVGLRGAAHERPEALKATRNRAGCGLDLSYLTRQQRAIENLDIRNDSLGVPILTS